MAWWEAPRGGELAARPRACGGGRCAAPFSLYRLYRCTTSVTTGPHGGGRCEHHPAARSRECQASHAAQRRSIAGADDDDDWGLAERAHVWTLAAAAAPEQPRLNASRMVSVPARQRGRLLSFGKSTQADCAILARLARPTARRRQRCDRRRQLELRGAAPASASASASATASATGAAARTAACSAAAPAQPAPREECDHRKDQEEGEERDDSRATKPFGQRRVAARSG